VNLPSKSAEESFGNISTLDGIADSVHDRAANAIER
jgi:hypothetical protein